MATPLKYQAGNSYSHLRTETSCTQVSCYMEQLGSYWTDFHEI
jgi:hypothetical protein